MILMSRHAAKRAAEMCVEEAEIATALTAPFLTYPNAAGHPRGTTYVAGRIAVPVGADGTVLTVLWHGRTQR
jgi:hypothetical protein